MTKSLKKTFNINGMHCNACQVLIKQDIQKINGIKSANVSMKNCTVTIESDNQNKIPSHKQLNDMFSNFGYTFEEGTKKSNLNRFDILKIIFASLVFVVGFFMIEKSGLLMYFSLDSKSSYLTYFLFGIGAGLSSCAALVGGLLLAMSKSWNNLYGSNTKKNYVPFLYFNVSRIVTFAFFGGVLGYLGSFLSLSITATSILTIIISFVMIIFALQMMGISWFNRFSINLISNNKYLNKNNQFNSKYVPVIIGALSFFIPCGFTIIAQTNTLTAANFYDGMFRLLAFSLGTLPVLALISFSSVKFYSNPSFSKKFSLFSGILIIFLALYTFNSQLNILGYKSLNDLIYINNTIQNVNNNSVKVNDTYQVINLKATGFEYLPKKVTIKSGLNTKLQIQDTGSVGCARAMYARGLYKDVIYLKPGLNTIEFIAPKPGTYKISCSMGMVDPVIVTVE